MKTTCAALTLLLLGCSALSAKTLVFCSEGNPESLNPQFVTTTTGENAARPMFDTLVAFPPGTTDIKPALAESWTISEDGTEYVFHLRRGVNFQSNARFHPTRHMNADDVLFSLLRQWKEDHPFHRTAGATFDYFKDMGMYDLLKEIDKLDDYTVRIRLTRPEAPFLADLAMAFNVILSAEYAAQMLKAGTPDMLDKEPVGTGPFQFDSYQKDVAVRYRSFPDYWDGRPKIDTLVFSITPNAAVRLTKLKAGECQVMAFPSPADSDAIKADPQLVLMRQEGLNIGYLSLNTSRPPFNDLRVRKAINLAVDKRAVVRSVYGPLGVVARNPIPPTLWSYNDAIADYPYDPEAAQKLLTEAGLSDGLDTELWYMPVSRPYNPDGKRVAEMIADDLAQVGIRVKLVTAEWSEYRTRLQAGEPPMALYGWTGDNGDPDNFLYVMLGCRAARVGGSNIAKWCDTGYDDLVTRAKLTPERAQRETLYKQAQVLVHDQAPWVPLAHSVVLMAARKSVVGFKMDPLGRHMFQAVDLVE